MIHRPGGERTKGMADHKALIRRMFEEVVNAGRLELVDELWHPDFLTDSPQGPMDREAFRQFIADWRAAFGDLHCEVDDLIVEGDRVAWSVRATGTHTGEFMGIPATGRAIDFDSLNVAEVRDGKGYRHKVVMDLTTLMQQLTGEPAGQTA